MNSQGPTDDQGQILRAAANVITQNTQVHFNLDQNCLIITDDKIQIILVERLTQLRARDGWQAPLGMLATVATTLATTTFKDTAVMKAPVAEALFYMSAVLSFCWLLHALVKLPKSVTPKQIIAEMKRASAPQATSGAGSVTVTALPAGSPAP